MFDVSIARSRTVPQVFGDAREGTVVRERYYGGLWWTDTHQPQIYASAYAD